MKQGRESLLPFCPTWHEVGVVFWGISSIPCTLALSQVGEKAILHFSRYPLDSKKSYVAYWKQVI